MSLPDWIISGLLAALFAAYSTFAYRYLRYSPWNSTWQGVTLLSQKITMAALVLFFVADTVFGNDYPGRYSLLIFLLTLLAVEGLATLAGHLHVQRATDKVSEQQGTGYVPPHEIDKMPTMATTIIYTGSDGEEKDERRND